MNQITLHRKGGRKPWVFKRHGQVYLFKCTVDGIEYTIQIRSDNIFIGTLKCEDYDEENGGYFAKYNDVSKQIHADHFTLGNVTITF